MTDRQITHAPGCCDRRLAVDDLIERLRALKWEEVYDDDRRPDDPTHKCVLVDMRPDDFRALLRDVAAEIEALRAAMLAAAPQQTASVDEVKETDLWRCTVCGRVGTVGRCCGEETRERVNMEQLLAENERLRDEVERLRTDGASAVRWAPSSAHWSEVLKELFGPDARNGIDVLETRWRKELERAERLAEALRELEDRVQHNEVLLRQALAALRNGGNTEFAAALIAQRLQNGGGE